MHQSLSRRALLGASLSTVAALVVDQPKAEAPAQPEGIDPLIAYQLAQYDQEQESRAFVHKHHFALPIPSQRHPLVRKFRKEMAARFKVDPRDIVVHGYLPGTLSEIPEAWMLSAVEPCGRCVCVHAQHWYRKPTKSETNLLGLRA